MRERKKTWEQKVRLVEGSYNRSKNSVGFARDFYENLFFLNPKIRVLFSHTDFAHQEKALLHGIEFMIKFLDHSDENARTQVKRIAHTHSGMGMKIHPHMYYYWIEALIMTSRIHDPSWIDDLE